MPPRNSPAYSDPLDLLRRFIPSPFRFTCHLGTVRVLVCTNDITLLPALPLRSRPEVPDPHTMEWKIVRDLDSRGPLQPTLALISSDLTIITMGTACLLGFDRRRRELLGFIGADVDLCAYRETILPVLHQIAQEAFSSPAHPELSFQSQINAND